MEMRIRMLTKRHCQKRDIKINISRILLCHLVWFCLSGTLSHIDLRVSLSSKSVQTSDLVSRWVVTKRALHSGCMWLWNGFLLLFLNESWPSFRSLSATFSIFPFIYDRIYFRFHSQFNKILSRNCSFWVLFRG